MELAEHPLFASYRDALTDMVFLCTHSVKRLIIYVLQGLGFTSVSIEHVITGTGDLRQ